MSIFQRYFPTSTVRVHDYDIRKLIQWYNILIDNGITDFEEEAENDTDEKEG